MKKLALFLCLLPLPLFAAEQPHAPCAGLRCPEHVREIEAGFQGGQGISRESLPLVASGECFHLSDQYSPHVAHHGIVLLEEVAGETRMGARFGQFFPENPYRHWGLETARKELPAKYSLELTAEFAFSDMNPGQSPLWLYWVKRAASGKIYVFGYWGVFHRVLCELSANE